MDPSQFWVLLVSFAAAYGWLMHWFKTEIRELKSELKDEITAKTHEVRNELTLKINEVKDEIKEVKVELKETREEIKEEIKEIKEEIKLLDIKLGDFDRRLCVIEVVMKLSEFSIIPVHNLPVKRTTPLELKKEDSSSSQTQTS